MRASQATWITALTFLIAFVLTFWPGGWRSVTAAILYSVGILTNLSYFAYFFLFFARMNFGLDDSGSAEHTFPVIGWLVPLSVFFYAVTMTVLLWPSIPQQKAIRIGKILHLIVYPILIVYFLAIASHQVPGAYRPQPFNLICIVYGLLWFRIRETYVKQEAALHILQEN